jgi:hypothetical protein
VVLPAIVPPPAEPTAIAHCPKLGFDDDPTNAFERPTRLHRCFAAGAPLPLSLDQQRELCLSDHFSTCPRLTMAGLVPGAEAAVAAELQVSGPGAPSARPDGKRMASDPARPPQPGMTVAFIAGGAVVLVVLVVIAYLLVPRPADMLAFTSVDAQVPQPTASPAPTLPPRPVQVAPQPAPDRQPAPVQSAAAPPQPALLRSAPAVVLDERFTNNDRNWPSAAQGTAFLSNGSYRLTPQLAGEFVAVGAPIADLPKDVVVNASFRKLDGPSGGGYGIIVRDQAAAPQQGTSQKGHYYVVEVGDKGEIGMWRRDLDQWVDLVPWQPNPAVKPGTARNEVSVQAVGNRLSLTVNGTQVATISDDTFSSGGVGLFAGGDGNNVAVDRFSVQTP